MVLAPEYLRMYYGHMCITVKRSFPRVIPVALVALTRYATASVEVRMKRGQGLARLQGAPVTYGLTIPGNAVHKTEAEKFAAFLLGQRGQRLFAKRGFHPVNPARCNPCDGLPSELHDVVVSGGH